MPIIDFADGIAIVVVAQCVAQVEVNTNDVVAEVKERLEEMGVELAEHKTGAVLINRRKHVKTCCIRVR